MKTGNSFRGKVRWSVLVLVLATLLLVPMAGISQANGQPSPPRAAPLLSADERPVSPRTGYRPPSMDLSHLTVQRTKSVLAPLQAVWDWRTQSGGRVTSVKNQGTCGACYAFAGIGNFESKMLMDGEGTFDYSEENAKECNWRELNSYQDPPGTWWGSCDGGNYYMLSSLFSQGGVVLETADPYNASDTACTTGLTYQKTLLDWRIISDFTTVADTTVLKNYIYTYGPVYSTIYVGDDSDPTWDAEFNTYDGSYTLDYSGAYDPNHAVLIVGWSNALPATTATPGVAADGWIVKNSWGTGWGDNGYFYITYGSAQIGRESSFMYDWQDYDPNGDIWYYDEDTWNYNYGWNTSDCGMVRFTPPANTWATRIEFWTNDIDTTVDVYLYDSVDGTGDPTNLLQQQTGNFYDESGYHSVELNPPAQLTSGDDVYAVACFQTNSYAFPIPCDSESSTETNRTWISDTGPTGGFWFDLGTQSTPCDAGIRLRTSTVPTAVDLVGFEATSLGDAVQVDWVTAAELDSLGFNLYRAGAVDEPRVRLNASLILAQASGVMGGASYTFLDEAAGVGANYYWLEEVALSGEATFHGPIVVEHQPLRRLLPARPRLGPREFINFRR